jgi:hypothetical protein
MYGDYTYELTWLISGVGKIKSNFNLIEWREGAGKKEIPST